MANSYKVSSDGLEEIIAHEGEILEVYADPVGLPTLGVGHLLTPSERRTMPVGTKITRAESRAYLRKDLAKFERCINDAVKVPINQNQFDALVSLAFNIGEANFEKSTVLRLLNKSNYIDAAEAFLRWNKARKNGVLTVLPGLTTRRKRERALFLKKPLRPVLDSDADSSRPSEPGTVPEGADGLSATSDPAPSSVSTIIKAATEWANTPGTKQAVVKSGSVFTVALAFLYTNWWILLILLIAVVAIVWYLRAKRSSTE